MGAGLMPKRRRGPISFAELYAAEKERVLDQLARAQAGQEGRPAFSRRPNDVTVADAWNAVDPNVTDQHFAEIAMQTVQEMTQERDEQGRPMWSLEDIENETRLRQSLAKYPYRAMTYSTGYRADDYEGMAKEAARVAKRLGQPAPVMDSGGWSEIEEEDALTMTPPEQVTGQQPVPPEPTMERGY